jgi:uncharacterized protein (TIGR02270 family)
MSLRSKSKWTERLAISTRRFNVGLYREHLQEASFLYGQRQSYHQDPEVNWEDLQSWEERFEAHIDALVLGGDVAADVCRDHGTSPDPGEVHAALLTLCRQNRKLDVFAVLSSVDLADMEIGSAALRALRIGAPTNWRDDFCRAVHRTQFPVSHVLAQVVGYRRFECEELIHGLLTQSQPSQQAELAWVLGRVGTEASVPVLWSLLDSDEPRLEEAAALALLRLGDARPLQRATTERTQRSWSTRILAIGGDSRAVSVLLDRVSAGTADAGTVLALGLLGHLSAVAPLLDLLDNEDLSKAAAIALNTITGAELHARVFVPDQVDPEELQPEERAAYEKDGTVPTRLGEPYGNWERSPLVDKSGWLLWFQANKQGFSRDLRWRVGLPYSPSALLQCLQAETTPYAVRAATAEELVVRYAVDVPFEVDLSVVHQRRILKTIGEWVSREGHAFVPGDWYFHGGRQI